MSTLRVTLNESDAVQGPLPEQLLSFDAEEFRRNFNRRPFLVRHQLAGHPLFHLAQLIQLSRRLPAQSVKYNDGNLSVAENLEAMPSNGLSIEETIRRIEQQCSWMVLKNVQDDAEYRQLLLQCLDAVKQYSEPIDPGMCEARAFIFISSPGSVTPFHIDPEINFLLQVRGSKAMSVFDPADREILPERDLEQFSLAEDLGVVKYKEEFQGRAFVASLTPGVGVHCPVTAPHWVKVGPEVSISFSITFRSPSTRRKRSVYWMNAHLRRLGLSPTPVGASQWKDTVKQSLFLTLASARKVVGQL
jgi:hypothetical protein